MCINSMFYLEIYYNYKHFLIFEFSYLGSEKHLRAKDVGSSHVVYDIVRMSRKSSMFQFIIQRNSYFNKK